MSATTAQQGEVRVALQRVVKPILAQLRRCLWLYSRRGTSGYFIRLVAVFVLQILYVGSAGDFKVGLNSCRWRGKVQ